MSLERRLLLVSQELLAIQKATPFTNGLFPEEYLKNARNVDLIIRGLLLPLPTNLTLANVLCDVMFWLPRLPRDPTELQNLFHLFLEVSFWPLLSAAGVSVELPGGTHNFYKDMVRFLLGAGRGNWQSFLDFMVLMILALRGDGARDDEEFTSEEIDDLQHILSDEHIDEATNFFEETDEVDHDQAVFKRLMGYYPSPLSESCLRCGKPGRSKT